MCGAPSTATTISVSEALAKFDGEFGAMATALENGEFALWVGSGISRRAPSLGDLITRAIEFLRQKAVDPAETARYRPALTRALKLAGVEIADVEAVLDVEFTQWPGYAAIRDVLWGKYSDLLDVRLPGESVDFLLWNAVDIREAFSHPAPPASEHLSIAILVLEGAISEIVSANWDGFIEAAIEDLAGGTAGNLQVVVDPGNLRDAPGKARLLKFHGCIIHAAETPAIYRDFLVASKTQIINWPESPALAAMRGEVISAATNLKALMLGLSLQDGNLQSVFAKAKHANPWPWPCAPQAQAHVFCEDQIGDGQRQMLKTVYADAYNDHIDEIEGSALFRAWGEQVLLALVLRLIADKLAALMRCRLEGNAMAVGADELIASLTQLRNAVAVGAVGDRTAFAKAAIAVWSRMVSLFRAGRLPIRSNAYELISGGPVGQLQHDHNARAAGFGELGIALALLQHGEANGLWRLTGPSDGELVSGALTSTATWDGAQPRIVFFVRSAGVALDLKKQGAFSNDNAIVIHADDAWHQLQAGAMTARRPKRAPGRTGSTGTLHVSVTQLLESEADVAGLRKRFISEVTL